LSNRPDTRIAIVTGYKGQSVDDVLNEYKYDRFYNPLFDITNSIVSLWFASSFIDEKDDLIVMNGDVFFDKKVLDVIYDDNNEFVLLADSSRIKEADYRFNWSNDGLLKKYGKELADDETTGEYVGIAKISKSVLPKFKARLMEMINTQQHGKWWEDVVYSFVKDNTKINIKDISGLFWAEVDYVEDYERILEEVAKKKGL
jgi:choline kinase